MWEENMLLSRKHNFMLAFDYFLPSDQERRSLVNTRPVLAGSTEPGPWIFNGRFRSHNSESLMSVNDLRVQPAPPRWLLIPASEDTLDMVQT